MAALAYSFKGTDVVLGRVIKDGKFDAKVMRKFQSDVAQARLAEAQRAEQFPTETKQYVSKVDLNVIPNKSGQEKRVKMDGNIRYIRFDIEAQGNFSAAMVEMIRLIMRKVPYRSKNYWLNGDPRSRVPFRTRHYRDSFAMMRNNVMVIRPGARFESRATRWILGNADAMKDTDVLSVTNIQPYARRIEEGAHFQKPWSTQNSRGVFNGARSEAIRSRKTSGLYIGAVEYGPLPGGASNLEYNSQGQVTYAEGRTMGRGKQRAFKYSGRIMRKHRVYPILSFGPPRTGATFGTNRSSTRWTNRANQYKVMGNTESSQQTIASQIRRAGGLVQ